MLQLTMQPDEDDFMMQVGALSSVCPGLAGAELAVSPRVSSHAAAESVKMLFMFQNLRRLQLRLDFDSIQISQGLVCAIAELMQLTSLQLLHGSIAPGLVLAHWSSLKQLAELTLLPAEQAGLGDAQLEQLPLLSFTLTSCTIRPHPSRIPAHLTWILPPLFCLPALLPSCLLQLEQLPLLSTTLTSLAIRPHPSLGAVAPSQPHSHQPGHPPPPQPYVHTLDMIQPPLCLPAPPALLPLLPALLQLEQLPLLSPTLTSLAIRPHPSRASQAGRRHLTALAGLWQLSVCPVGCGLSRGELQALLGMPALTQLTLGLKDASEVLLFGQMQLSQASPRLCLAVLDGQPRLPPSELLSVLSWSLAAHLVKLAIGPLAAACPGDVLLMLATLKQLQELKLQLVAPLDTHSSGTLDLLALTPLRRLTCLELLASSRLYVPLNVKVISLASLAWPQLAALRLSLAACEGLSNTGLAGLTSLTCLTRLVIEAEATPGITLRAFDVISCLTSLASLTWCSRDSLQGPMDCDALTGQLAALTRLRQLVLITGQQRCSRDSLQGPMDCDALTGQLAALIHLRQLVLITGQQELLSSMCGWKVVLARALPLCRLVLWRELVQEAPWGDEPQEGSRLSS
ncbi:hypothetical protein OEZ85_006138 [Tetradesmus obliquus]|uniref:Uncharacterized protein n=1 Tax=Tetradesmus obliquus TaxID=3088 RepID=A0ABY8UFN6_TETOB|nr:hypothetical protein OEZ85_006138 [Tetradesmus obliquus]